MSLQSFGQEGKILRFTVIFHVKVTLLKFRMVFNVFIFSATKFHAFSLYKGVKKIIKLNLVSVTNVKLEIVSVNFFFLVKQLNRHIITIINFVLTVVGSFVFAYKAVEYSSEQPKIELVRYKNVSCYVTVFITEF